MPMPSQCLSRSDRLDGKGRASRIPWSLLSWLNMLSFDAVLVGVIWQCVFTRQFCERWPHFYESGILGISIWLAYTADRLLDARRLDRARPHTLRHEMHQRHHWRYSVAWVAVLGVNTILISTQATEGQLRVGFIAIAFVLAYIAGIHFRPRPVTQRWHIPKEILAGLIFAFGVSLNCWSQVSFADVRLLALTTLTASILYTLNCLAVATWESNLDSQQGFQSLINRYPKLPQWMQSCVLAYSGFTFFLGITGLVPFPIAVCLSLSSLGLLLCIYLFRQTNLHSSEPSRHEPSRVLVASDSTLLGLTADAAISLAPAILLCPGVLPFA